MYILAAVCSSVDVDCRDAYRQSQNIFQEAIHVRKYCVDTSESCATKDGKELESMKRTCNQLSLGNSGLHNI